MIRGKKAQLIGDHQSPDSTKVITTILYVIIAVAILVFLIIAVKNIFIRNAP